MNKNNLTILAIILGMLLILDRLFISPLLDRVTLAETELGNLQKDKSKGEVFLSKQEKIKDDYNKLLELCKQTPYEAVSSKLKKSGVIPISLSPSHEKKKVSQDILEMTYIAQFKGDIKDLIKVLAVINGYPEDVLNKDTSIKTGPDLKGLKDIKKQDPNFKIKQVTITPLTDKPEELSFSLYISVLYSQTQ